MGCSSGSCSTGDGKCGCSDCGCMCPTDMLQMIADKAWKQVMIDKMKAHWEKKRGSQMDKMAAAAVEASFAAWEDKMKSKEDAEKHKEALWQSMH